MKKSARFIGATFALALVFTLISAQPAQAAVDRMVIERLEPTGVPGTSSVCTHIMEGTTDTFNGCFPFSIENATTSEALVSTANAVLRTYGTIIEATPGFPIVWSGITRSDLATVASTGSYNDLANKPTIPGIATSSVLSLSLSTSTGAVGTQVSTTTGSWVVVAGQVSTTASIAGNAAGDIIVEVAPTNSATAGDWIEWGRIGNSQALTLAITLQSIQIVKGQVFAYVPAGYYIKARTSGSGTVSYTLNTVKKVTQ